MNTVFRALKISHKIKNPNTEYEANLSAFVTHALKAALLRRRMTSSALRSVENSRRQMRWLWLPLCAAAFQGFSGTSPRPVSTTLWSSRGGKSRKPPMRKKGDWTCESCQGHNFASRISCFRCHAPRNRGPRKLEFCGKAVDPMGVISRVVDSGLWWLVSRPQCVVNHK